jgi:hypothetical protein
VGDELRAAIDGLYDAFAAYPRPPWFVACACCWSGDPLPPDYESVGIRSPGGPRPLRSIDASELAPHASDTTGLAGTLDVWKHYLPRLLEITAGPGFPANHPSIEMVFGRLTYRTSWTEWPAAEQRALRLFFHALWEYRLAAEVDDDEWESAADDALCAVGVVDPDFDWYLDRWLESPHPNAALHLERFLQLNATHLAEEGELWNAFWNTDDGPGPTNARRLLAWIRTIGGSGCR